MYSTTDDINQKRLYNVIAFKMSIYLVCHLANLHLPSFSREKKIRIVYTSCYAYEILCNVLTESVLTSPAGCGCELVYLIFSS